MKIIEVQHPLVQHKMGLMRRKDISNKEFRELVAEVGTLVAFEATRDLETEDAVIEGWAGPTHVRRLAGKVTLVPILRAGLGMLQGVLAALPTDIPPGTVKLPTKRIPLPRARATTANVSPAPAAKVAQAKPRRKSARTSQGNDLDSIFGFAPGGALQ